MVGIDWAGLVAVVLVAGIVLAIAWFAWES